MPRQVSLQIALSSLFVVLATANGLPAAAPVAGLSAGARNGQVFLTWQEAPTTEGTTFNVYVSNRPITDVRQAHAAARHIEQHSARDWWEDPASFTKGAPAVIPVGFLIQAGAPRLDPAGGLFVYTVPEKTHAPLFFAVTSTNPQEQEDATVEPGTNSLRDGVSARPGDIQPIWQRTEAMPARGAGTAKALWLNLHAKGGVVKQMEYLVFGNELMGWRAGLPFKFSVRIQGDEVVVSPTDRVWINRPHTEAGDGGMPAIWTFWYGYNSHIDDRKRMSTGVPINYTERRNLWILDWVRAYYQPDPNRWYCSGSSMGGCGTISFGLHHPELFAALHAHVPIVSYTYLGRGSAHRLEPSCWVGAIPPDLKTNEGVSLLARMDGTKYVNEAKVDLPPVFLINGRQDNSIPWQNNPPFYRALSDARQHFAAFWDNGDHSNSGKDAPPDVQKWRQDFHRFRLNESFPVFTNASSNRNPGNGDPTNGDIEGWINRGMDWKDIQDTPEQYAITLLANYPGIEYPVQSDVTIRRRQKFQPLPGELLEATVGSAPAIATKTDGSGLLTVLQAKIPSKEGVRMVIRRPRNTDK